MNAPFIGRSVPRLEDLPLLKNEGRFARTISFAGELHMRIVRSSVQSVWEAILFGLILSLCIIYFFLKSWGTTLTGIIVIPVTVLITLVATPWMAEPPPCG